MSILLAALTAAQLLIASPVDAVGTTRRDALAHLGEPLSTGSDVVGAPGQPTNADRVVTLDFKKTRVRLYESPEASSRLIYVATVDEAFPTRTGVHVGVNRQEVLRELGGPAYEDDDQIIYVDPRADDPTKSDRVRIVLDKDRVAGIEWTFN